MKRPIGLVCLIFISVSLFPLEVTLDESEAMALNNSQELKNQQSSMEISHFSYQLGIRNFFPQFSFTYSNSRQTRYNSTDSDSIQLGVNIDQPIFDGGRTLIQRELTGIQLNLQSANLEKQRDSIRNSVWQLYHQVYITRQKLDLQRELYKISEEQLDITQKKYDIGSITEIDLVESKIEVQSLEIDIVATENQYHSLLSQLNSLLGLPVETELVLFSSIDTEYTGISLSIDDKDYYYNIALSRNLDIKSARVETTQAKAQYDIATRSLIPTISLEGGVNFSGEQFPLQTPSYNAKLNIQFPFKAVPVTTSVAFSSTPKVEYSSSNSYSVTPLSDMSFLVDKKSAAIQLTSSMQKEQDTQNNLIFNIEEQLKDLKQKRSSIILNRKALSLQKQKQDILAVKYKLGEVKELDLLKSNIDYYNQEIAIWQSILELILSERAFEQLLGLGLGELSNLGVQK
ncbi:TolC family protein [Spirochaeta cellobiosiphila]|uniref:TolC family protein n=1 Tax=Spirochaeta cellobiosiphila TaxID=504483 RepID=UPI0003F5AADF|nr:TolC family protein [Spirochaeta cellobiosiphila]